MKATPFTKFYTLRTPSPAQIALHRVIYDGAEQCELDAEQRELARQIFGDVDRVHADVRRVVVIAKGRGVGGSRAAAERMVHLGVTGDLSALGKNELAYCFLGGPKLRHARVSLRFAHACATAHGLRMTDDNADSFTILRHDGRRVRFEAFAASRGGDNTRGVPILGGHLGEAGFYADESTGVANGEAILAAMMPRLLRSGQIVIESSCWGESGILYVEFSRNHGAPQTALAAHCPTGLMRPDPDTAAMIAKERMRDPANAEREFDARFIVGGGSFFDGELLRDATDETLAEQLSCPQGWIPFAGCDVGLKHDNSAIVVVHRSVTEPVVIRIAEVLELRPTRFRPLALADVVDAFCEVAERHGLLSVTSDHHMLSEVQLRASTHAVTFAQAPGGAPAKAEQHIRARDLFRARCVRMPATVARLREQLGRITSTPSAGGTLMIRSPRSGTHGHGDAASACVLALHSAALGGSIPIDWEWIDSMRAASPRPLETPSSAGIGGNDPAGGFGHDEQGNQSWSAPRAQSPFGDPFGGASGGGRGFGGGRFL